MVKSKNKQKDKRLKKRINLNLSAELYEKIKKAGLNVSRFAEEALNALISGKSFENIQNTLILSLESKKEWTRGDSNSGPPPCQGDVIFGPDLENKPNSESLNFSNPSRKNTNSVNSSDSNYARQDELKGSDSSSPMSLADLQESHISGYEDYCLSGDDSLSPGTYRDYRNAVATYGQSITCPADIRSFYRDNEVPLPEKVGKGAARLFRYLKIHQVEEHRKLNGFSYGDYIDAFNEAKSAEGAKKDSIAHNVSPSELKRWVAEVPERYGDFFLLLAYTGARIEQLHDILKELSPEEREKRGEVIMPGGEVPVESPVFRMNVSDLGSERKRTNMYYVPYECRELLLTYTPKFSADNFSKAIRPEGLNASRKDGKVVSGKTLRKWNTNLFLSAGVPAEVAGWIEGRIPTKHNSASAVTWKNYGDLDGLSAVAYSKLQGSILNLLPLDTKFGTKPVEKESVPKEEPKPPKKKNAAAEMLKKKGINRV